MLSAGDDAEDSSVIEAFGSPGFRKDIGLPAGQTYDTMLSMLSTIDLDGVRPPELDVYLTEDFERFLITLQLVAGASGAGLEIGANPYFLTVLLGEFTDLTMHLTNCFDPTATGSGEQIVSYTSATTGHVRAVPMTYAHVNVETQLLPYADESMDVAIFCEVIEHLTIDPVVALAELHRVLKTGGTLIVSTPNVARLENVARIVAGANLYDPYSGYGVYGRHNREYTRHELVHLLLFCGFDVPDHFTADVHANRSTDFMELDGLVGLLEHRRPDLGQYLFCRAVKARPIDTGRRPEQLYRSVPHQRLVPM